MSSPQKKRLSELDGLRGLAVLGVILFHYCNRFPEFYPYTWGNLDFLSYGKMGVQLFFIISGFVIFFSLQRGNSIAEFVVKRGARLIPPMMLCSVITFTILWSIDTPFSLSRRVGLEGFLPSWTLTDPRIWKPAFPEAAYIDGAYWTLFFEARFYAISALIAFLPVLKSVSMLQKLSGLCIILYTLRALSMIFIGGKAVSIIDFFFATQFLYLFWAGALFQRLFSGSRNIWLHIGIIASLSLALSFTRSFTESSIITLMYILFLSYAYTPKYLPFLRNRALVFVGTISYSVYLLHQNIGVTFISMLPRDLPNMTYISALFGITAFIIFLGWLVFVWIETRTHHISKAILNRIHVAKI